MYSNLVDLCSIIEATRQNGKTSILAEAVQNSEGVLVVHSHDFGKQLQQKYPKLVCANSFNIDSLRGLSKPIFIDHSCLFNLVLDMKNKYEKQISDLENEIEDLKNGK